MRLPRPLVIMRSTMAQAIALILRPGYPFFVRLLRFAWEIRARSLLRGRIAPGVQFIGAVIVDGTGNVHIGPGTRVGRRVTFETYGDARIEIGSRVTINDGATLVAYAGLTIGDDAMVGEFASVRDADHGHNRSQRVRMQHHVAESVTIGADVWLGRGVAVLKGVTLGDGVIIGANSVVTRGVPAYTIAAGAPARPIGERKP